MSTAASVPPLVRSFAIGVAGGMRSQLPLALLANGPLGRSSDDSLLGEPLMQRLTFLAAGTELVVDKLPGVGSRLAPGPLTARLVLGGIAGGVIAAHASQPRLAGIALGAAGALMGAWTGYHLRAGLVSATALPDVAYAVAEDLTALGIGLVATRAVST